MVYSLFYRVLSISLSVLVLVSTFTFTVEKHFCGDHLVDTAILSSAKKCGGMDVEENDSKKTCCKDTVDVVEGQDKLTKNDIQYLDIEIVTLYTFIYSQLSLYNSLDKPIIPHNNYAPPNIVKDIHILDETYLI